MQSKITQFDISTFLLMIASCVHPVLKICIDVFTIQISVNGFNFLFHFFVLYKIQSIFRFVLLLNFSCICYLLDTCLNHYCNITTKYNY